MSNYILNLLSNCGFCLFLLAGLLIIFSRKQYFSAQLMQKMCGTALILVSLHVAMLSLEATLGATTFLNVLRGILLIIDLVVIVAYIILAVMGNQKQEPASKPATEPVATTASAPIATAAKPIVPAAQPATATEQVAPTPQAQAEDAPASTSATSPAPDAATTPAPVDAPNDDTAETPTLPDDEPEDALATADNTEEPEDDTPVESQSIDDLIFFQKVEALMANKKLFTEQDVNREQIAMEIGTNRTYLARSIKSATGKTFLAYITDLRTSYAATLLSTTTEPLDLIGIRAGFGSKSAYYRAFAAAYGCTPSEYRKKL